MLRLAIRNLVRSPLFTLVAVMSLALGIGANTAIFSLFDQILLRPIFAKNPRELVLLDSPGANRGMVRGRHTFSYPMYQLLRDNNQVFRGVLARCAVPATLAVDGGEGQRIDAELVSGNYFEVLGVGAHVGRTLTVSDDTTPGAHPAAVLSYDFWKTRFAGDPSITGRKIHINRLPFEVVGVAQEGFRGVQTGLFPAMFFPIMMKREITPTWDELFNRRALWLQLMARLNPGVSAAQAQASLQPYYRAVLEEELREMTGDISQNFRERFLAKPLLALDGAGGVPFFQQDAVTPLVVLLVMTGLVVLIACANVSNLLLARAVAREKETAVRLALGAGRGHLLRQLLAESALLGLLGGGAGIVLAVWTLRLLFRFLPDDGIRAGLSADPGLNMLLYSLALSLAAACGAGLFPSLRASRPDIGAALKEQTGSASRGTLRWKKALVAAQMALSLLLMIGSGLLIRTLLNLRAVDPGFRTENLISFGVDAPLAGFKTTQTGQIYGQLLEHYGALAGVQSAILAEHPLLGGSSRQNTVRVEGYQAREGENMNPYFNSVSEDFFTAMGIPLVAGREFKISDHAEAGKVAVVNDVFVRYFFGNANPLGRRFATGSRKPDITIVGVVRDGKSDSLRQEPGRRVYLPFRQVQDLDRVTFYVRTALAPQSMMGTVRRETGARFAGLSIFDPKTIAMQINEVLTGERVVAGLCAAFGAVATLLAALGLYGVMAWSVARRTREIGIRMALGAERKQLVGMVLREVTLVAALGMAAGLPLAFALTRYLRSELYGLSPHDPRTIAGAVALLGVVAFLAGYLPARRASRVDPLVALRYE